MVWFGKEYISRNLTAKTRFKRPKILFQGDKAKFFTTNPQKKYEKFGR